MRKIACIKKFLTSAQCETCSCLLFIDYCNTLYFGIGSQIIKQLQMIQNRGCVIGLGLKKHQSLETHLQQLHWFKVQEQRECIFLLAFKCLNGLVPSYLSDLLQYKNLSGSLLPTLNRASCHSSQ